MLEVISFVGDKLNDIYTILEIELNSIVYPGYTIKKTMFAFYKSMNKEKIISSNFQSGYMSQNQVCDHLKRLFNSISDTLNITHIQMYLFASYLSFDLTNMGNYNEEHIKTLCKNEKSLQIKERTKKLIAFKLLTGFSSKFLAYMEKDIPDYEVFFKGISDGSSVTYRILLIFSTIITISYRIHRTLVNFFWLKWKIETNDQKLKYYVSKELGVRNVFYRRNIEMIKTTEIFIDTYINAFIYVEAEGRNYYIFTKKMRQELQARKIKFIKFFNNLVFETVQIKYPELNEYKKPKEKKTKILKNIAF